MPIFELPSISITFIAGQDGEGQQLAVRFAGLYSDRGYRQQPSHEYDRRYYSTVAWKPFSSTLFQFNYERIDIDAAYPNAIPPGDGSYSLDRGREAVVESFGRRGERCFGGRSRGLLPESERCKGNVSLF